jgi:hypothetical protein
MILSAMDILLEANPHMWLPQGLFTSRGKGPSPKTWNVMIGGNKRYPVFGYMTSNKWACFFPWMKSLCEIQGGIYE